MLSVSFVNEKGYRPSQEDFAVQNNPAVQNSSEAKQYLVQLYTKIRTETANMRPGSCALSAVLTPDFKLTVFNIGDSLACLYIIRGDSIELLQINSFHVEENAEERNRVISAGGRLENGYFISSCGVHQLGMYRFLGNSIITSPAKSSEPECFEVDLASIKLKEGDRLFAGFMSDGMYPTSGSLRRHLDYIRSVKNGMMPQIFNNIVKNIRCDTDDNYTFFLAELTNFEIDKAYAFHVFDGHAGCDVSKYAAVVAHSFAYNLSLPEQDVKVSQSAYLKSPELCHLSANAVLNLFPNIDVIPYIHVTPPSSSSSLATSTSGISIANNSSSISGASAAVGGQMTFASYVASQSSQTSSKST